MNLFLLLSVFILSASSGRADAQTPSSGRLLVVASDTTTKPSPELTRLDQSLTDAQRRQKDGRQSPEAYKDWVNKFRTDLAAAMARVPSTPANAVLHAEILLRLGESGQAVASLDQALQQAPNDPALKTAKGYALYDRKDYAAAAAAANAVLKDAPRSQEALWLKHASEDRHGPNLMLPGSPWGNLMPQQGIVEGPASHDDSNLPIKLVSEISLKTVDVPLAATDETSPSPGKNSLPLWPMTIPLGVGLIGYGVSRSKQTYASEGGLNPDPDVPPANGARNWRLSAAVAGAAFVGMAAWEYGPGALATAQAFFTAAAPTAPTLTPAMAGAGTGGGSFALDQTLVTSGIKAAGTAAGLIGGAKVASDYYSYAKAASQGPSDSRGSLSKGDVGEALTPQEKEEIRDSWDRATFQDEESSMRYHYDKHGEGQGWVRYTREAREFFLKFRSAGRPIELNNGQMGIKISADGKFGIFTTVGRIVTYGPK